MCCQCPYIKSTATRGTHSPASYHRVSQLSSWRESDSSCDFGPCSVLALTQPRSLPSSESTPPALPTTLIQHTSRVFTTSVPADTPLGYPRLPRVEVIILHSNFVWARGSHDQRTLHVRRPGRQDSWASIKNVVTQFIAERSRRHPGKVSMFRTMDLEEVGSDSRDCSARAPSCLLGALRLSLGSTLYLHCVCLKGGYESTLTSAI